MGLFALAFQANGQLHDTTSQPSIAEIDINADSLVYMDFIVELDGSISGINVAKVICKGCSKKFKKSMINDATRALRKMPKWKNTGNGKRTSFTLPIQFGEDKL